jgi:hypothetical protein
MGRRSKGKEANGELHPLSRLSRRSSTRPTTPYLLHSLSQRLYWKCHSDRSFTTSTSVRSRVRKETKDAFRPFLRQPDRRPTQAGRSAHLGRRFQLRSCTHLEPLLGLGPVVDVPVSGQVVGLDVLVLEVEGVLPDVDSNDRSEGEERVLVGGGSDLELLGGRVVSLKGGEDEIRMPGVSTVSSQSRGRFGTSILTSHPHPDPWTARVAVLNAFLKAGRSRNRRIRMVSFERYDIRLGAGKRTNPRRLRSLARWPT